MATKTLRDIYPDYAAELMRGNPAWQSPQKRKTWKPLSENPRRFKSGEEMLQKALAGPWKGALVTNGTCKIDLGYWKSVRGEMKWHYTGTNPTAPCYVLTLGNATCKIKVG